MRTNFIQTTGTASSVTPHPSKRSVRAFGQNKKHSPLMMTGLCLFVSAHLTAMPTIAADKAPARKSEQRTLVFPSEVSLGRLELHALTNPTFVRDLGEARGTVKFAVPPDCYVLLYPGKPVGKNPALLNKAPTHGIEKLKIKFFSLEEDGKSVTDQILNNLPRFKDLQQLEAAQSDVTDDGLEPIANISTLKVVNLFLTEIHGTCLKTLKKLPLLEELDISFNSIETGHLNNLKEMESLKCLNLRKSGINREAVRYIGKCKHLQSLNLGLNRRVNDECMDSLLSLSNLHYISLDSTSVTKAGVLKLQTLPLQLIELPPSVKSTQDVAEIQKAFPKCQLWRSGLPRRVTKLEARVLAPLK